MTKGLTARRGWGGGGDKTFVNWANDNKVKKATFTRIRTFLKTLFQGAEESVSKEISCSVLVPVWRRVSFKMASKVFIEEVDKVSNFSRIYCSYFLDLAMLRSLLSQKTDFGTFLEWNVQWCFEFEGFLSIVQQIIRAFISTGHTFKGRCTATLTNLDTIGGYIVGFKCAYF